MTIFVFSIIHRWIHTNAQDPKSGGPVRDVRQPFYPILPPAMLRPALSARVGLRLAHSRVVPLRPRPQQRQLARTQTRCFSIYEVPPVPQLTEAILNTPLSSYALTIVCLTFVLRAGLTLPTTLWQRRRMARVREIIGPEMKRKNDELAPLVARQSRKDGLSYEEYQKRLKKEVSYCC